MPEETVAKHNKRKISETLAKLTGNVEFDFGYVALPLVGTAHVKGHFPRLHSQFSRRKLNLEETTTLKSSLAQWAKTFFDTNEYPMIFDGMVETVALFIGFIYPFQQLDSVAVQLTFRLTYWICILDNILEVAIKEVSVDILENGTRQLLQLLSDNTQPFTEVSHFPHFSSLFHSLQHFLQSIGQYRPNYQEKMDPFYYSIKRYFNEMRRQAVASLDGTSTDEAFLNYRTILSYYDITVTVIWILESDKTSLPLQIANCPSIRQILDLVNCIGGCTNDLLGMRKGFNEIEEDNFVVFKVLQKGIPITDAVAQVCNIISDKLEDFLRIRDYLLQKFSYEDNLVKYLNILEVVLDGNNRFFANTPRYQSVGLIQMIN